MRLLHTRTCRFFEKDPKTTKYAILSHTWDTEKGEQTYEELKKIQEYHYSGSQSTQGRLPSPPIQDQDEASPQVTHAGQSQDVLPAVADVPSLTPAPTQTSPLTSAWTPPDAAASPNDPHPISPEPPSTNPLPPVWKDEKLSLKIRDACRIARENGYDYIWIDSCCIDKTSSSEFSEAINSMYAWYAMAEVCYAYLADVPPGKDHHAEGSSFRTSRWFTRGWTLQELIAPSRVEFLSSGWAPIGSKQALVDLVEVITNISYKALLKLEPLDAFSVAQRLSWAATRETTRDEDQAYSLLGLFGINMPTLYGEGGRGAFRRLQEQIMDHVPDQSLFAWGEVYLGSQHQGRSPALTDTPTIFFARQWAQHQSPFAGSPRYFGSSGSITTLRAHSETIRTLSPFFRPHQIEYTSTPYGIRTKIHMIPLNDGLPPSDIDILHGQVELDSLDRCGWYLAILGCEHADRPGHLLGRVCYILPSGSDHPEVDLVYTGLIRVNSRHRSTLCSPDLFPLSPKIIQKYSGRIQVKTVYIPHLDRTPDLFIRLDRRPYKEIKLVLLDETKRALSSTGYSVNLSTPNPDPRHAHPHHIHSLTLSNSTESHAIMVDFNHTLEKNGRSFTIDAEVKTCRLRPDTTTDPVMVPHLVTTVSWNDELPWRTPGLNLQKVSLSVPGAGTLTVHINLDFAGTGVYILRINVLRLGVGAAPSLITPFPPTSLGVPPVESSPPAPSGVESDGRPGAGGRVYRRLLRVTKFWSSRH